MTNQTIRLLWTSLLLIPFFLGCHDHRFPGLSPSRLRLKTLTEQQGSARWVSEFLYDTQNRLSGITTTQNVDSTRSESCTYTYDNQDRLGQVNRVIRLRLPNEPTRTKTDSYLFSYTRTGQIAEIRYTNNSADNLLFICKPTYNAVNQITGNQLSGSNGFSPFLMNSQYTYTNDNLTGVSLTIPQTGQLFPYSFTYDDKINPFYGIITPTSTVNLDPMPLSPIAVFVYPPKNDGIANLMSLSRNNVLSDGYNNYIYSYNSTGLPRVEPPCEPGFLTIS